jgi:ubiquinone/menaquinone biosynthesis C-methylase UbiE
MKGIVRRILAATGVRFGRVAGPNYLQQQVERSWNKESRNLQWFGLKDGMSVLDLGCGPGYFVHRLANWLPKAVITALDLQESSLGYARSQLGNRATMIRASAERTGLTSESFDFVLARLLFQHVPDPLAVAREAHRLLKCGGRVVVTDIDDELFGIVEPHIAELKPLMARYSRAQALRGGNRLIGRSLPRLLRSAGFIDLKIECVAIHSDEVGMDACFPQLDPVPLRSLMAEGQLSQLEYTTLRDARQRLADSHESYALTLLFMVSGVKPMPQSDLVARQPFRT